MSVVLSRQWGSSNAVFKRGMEIPSRNFALRRGGKNAALRGGKASLNTIVFAMVLALVFAGAFYLYQVNAIAIKSYEVRDIEDQIQDLEKESQKLKIKEVETKSMYNIEKATENLNLINSANVSFVEMKGPMAMR